VYWSATGLSAVAAAAAVAAVRLSCRGLGLARAEALAVSALVASCPAVALFATQPGPQAVGLACSALAFAAVSRCIGGHGARAAAAGVWAALGAVVEEGGALLPLALAAVWLGRRASSAAPSSRALAAAAWSAAATLAMLAWWWEPFREALGKGFLRAFVPLSALWLLALARPRARPAAAALAVALVPCAAYAAAAAPAVRADGGALLALVLPLALLAPSAASRAALRAAIALSIVLGVARLAVHDQSRSIDACARGLHAVIAEPARARVIVRDAAERDLLAVADERVETVAVDAFVASFEVLAEREFYQQPIESALEAGLADLLAQGYRVFLTQGAEDRLRDRAFRVRHHVAVRVLDHLEARFHLAQLDAAGFRAKEIARR
jgi:hypothetical protein